MFRHPRGQTMEVMGADNQVGRKAELAVLLLFRKSLRLGHVSYTSSRMIGINILSSTACLPASRNCEEFIAE